MASERVVYEPTTGRDKLSVFANRTGGEILKVCGRVTLQQFSKPPRDITSIPERRGLQRCACFVLNAVTVYLLLTLAFVA